MPDVSSMFEVAALFALALAVCWPAIRSRLPQRSQSVEADTATHGARFEPRGSHLEEIDERPTHPLVAAPLPDAIYDDEEEYPTSVRPASAIDLPGEGVLPLAEALLRGEHVEVANGASHQPVLAHPNGGSRQIDDVAPQSDAPREPFKVLLVDGREKFRTSMLLKLARTGNRVFPVAKGREALDVFTREKSDLVLISRDALTEVGSDFVHRVHATSPHVPILVHGGKPGAGDLGPLKNGVDITALSRVGDDTEMIAEMVNCSLTASQSMRNVRDDQDVRAKILSELCFNLRSSLDVISGYTDILSDEPDLSRFRDLLDRMRQSTNAASVQMQGYVDVALDIPENVRQERVDLSTLSDRIERLVSRQIGTHPLRLTTTGPIEGSALFTDGEKLLSILSHVVTDAIKFTPTGEINIAVKSTADHTDFVVTDAGPGISADVPMPFAPMAAPPTGGDGASASGVGLAIAERLSRSIGATLKGTCGEGGAAAFTISIPSKLMTPSTEAASRMVH